MRSARQYAWSLPVRALLVLAVLVNLSACGTTNDESSPSSSSAATTSSKAGTSTTPISAARDEQIAGTVPSEIRSSGVLRVETDASYPPDEFIGPDGKTVIGLDADLSKAIADVLGLRLEMRNVPNDSVIPSLLAKRHDMAASSYNDTFEREKIVNFVTYFRSSTSFFTRAQGGTDIGGQADLCGMTLAVETASSQLADAKVQNAKCKKGGQPPIKILVFPTQTAANSALASGRAELSSADTPVADYQIQKSNGTLRIVGKPYGFVLYGLMFPKDSQLHKTVLQALHKLMDDGTYAKVLKKWGLESGAIKQSESVINGAVS